MTYLPIRNSAQLTPSAVHFQRCLPNADLAPHVTDFWQYDVRPPLRRVRIQVFPSACVVLRFNISQGGVEPVLYGPSLRSNMMGLFVREESVFGVALSLGGARAVVGCDIDEFHDLRLDLRDLWSRGLSELGDRLSACAGFADRVDVLARFLRARTAETRRSPPPDVTGAVAGLIREPSGRAMPPGLGITDRTLRRHFESNVGLSPKQVARVLRVQTTMQALAHRPDVTRSALAIDAGFSDQPHFNREFKRLLGMRPGQFAGYVGRFHEPELPIWSAFNRVVGQG